VTTPAALVPAASGVLYASAADLRATLSGTDSGSGTAAQLTDEQLTLALYAASNRVSVYAGSVYDSSIPEAVPPPILHDLTLDLAAFWASKTYMKYKAIPPDSPVYLAYVNAMSILQDVRAGKIVLDPGTAGSVSPAEAGRVINRIPPVFTGRDSNTRVSPRSGTLEADVPLDGGWAPMGTDWGDGTVYG
jgi:phage gp36-like protein